LRALDSHEDSRFQRIETEAAMAHRMTRSVSIRTWRRSRSRPRIDVLGLFQGHAPPGSTRPAL